MHPRISMSEISSINWSLEEDLQFYEANGIDNVGISVAKLDRAGWDEGIALVRESGIRVSNLIGLGPFRLADPTDWPAQRDRVHRALDAAELIRPGCVILTTGPAGSLSWEEAASRLAEALDPALKHARAIRVPIALEHTNSLRVDIGFVHTLRDVVDLARRLGTGVCCELNACWAERNIDTTLRESTDVIRVVQVSDFAIGTLATPQRLVPGDGDIPLMRLIHTLVDAGFAGDFDIEMVGPAIEDEGYESAIRRAIEWLTRVLEAAPS